MTYKIKNPDFETEVQLYFNKYEQNRRTSIALIDLSDGLVFSMISINLPEAAVGFREFCVHIGTKEIFDVEQFLKENDIAEHTGRFHKSGYLNYPIYKLLV